MSRESFAVTTFGNWENGKKEAMAIRILLSLFLYLLPIVMKFSGFEVWDRYVRWKYYEN